MNQNESTPFEPRLSPEFAARVLRQADLLIAGRRRLRRAIAGCTAVSILTIATVMGLRAVRPANPGSQSPPSIAEAALGSGDLLPSGQIDQGDALSYLFPDAAPLARFDATYSAATSDTGDSPLAQNTGDDGGSP